MCASFFVFVSVIFLTRKLQGDFPDPDVSYSTFCYDTSDTSSTTAVRSSQPDPVPVDPDALEKLNEIMSELKSRPHLKEMFRFVEENSMKMRSMSQDVQ